LGLVLGLVLLERHLLSWHSCGDTEREGFVGGFDIEELNACGDIEM